MAKKPVINVENKFCIINRFRLKYLNPLKSNIG